MIDEVSFAMLQASQMRRDASVFRQMGFRAYADYLVKQASAAERWAAKKARGSDGPT